MVTTWYGSAQPCCHAARPFDCLGGQSRAGDGRGGGEAGKGPQAGMAGVAGANRRKQAGMLALQDATAAPPKSPIREAH